MSHMYAPFGDRLLIECYSLKPTLTDLDGGLFAELVARDSIPAALSVMTYEYTRYETCHRYSRKVHLTLTLISDYINKLLEFPKMSIWATLLKCTPDKQFMEHLKLCHKCITIENNWVRLQGSGVGFVGTKTLRPDWQVSVRANCF